MGDRKSGGGERSRGRAGTDGSGKFEDVFSGFFGADGGRDPGTRPASGASARGDTDGPAGRAPEEPADRRAARTAPDAPGRSARSAAASGSRAAAIRAVVRAGFAAGAKSLALSAAILGPGFLLLLSGATVPGMIWLFVGSFGLMAWTYRKPWRLGWISALLPPGAAALCYVVQLLLFQSSAPSVPVVAVAAGVGAAFGVWRARTHVVSRAPDGGIVAERTFGYLLVWALAYGCTQFFSMLAVTVLLVRAGLVTGAFTTAMLVVVSIEIFRKGAQLRAASAAVLLLAIGLMAAPGTAQAQAAECRMLRDGLTASFRSFARIVNPRLQIVNVGGDTFGDTACRWELNLGLGSVQASLVFEMRAAASPEEAQYWVHQRNASRISGIGDDGGRYAASNSPAGSRYDMFSSAGPYWIATGSTVTMPLANYQEGLSNGEIDDLNALAYARMRDIHAAAHFTFSQIDYVRVFAAVSAALVAAGVAVNVAQAIAMAIANAVQAGVELTADEIQSAIAEALLAGPSLRGGGGDARPPPTGGPERDAKGGDRPGSWYEAQRNRPNAPPPPPGDGPSWWDGLWPRGERGDAPSPDGASGRDDAGRRGGASTWYEAQRNRAEAGGRPPPDGAGGTERAGTGQHRSGQAHGGGGAGQSQSGGGSTWYEAQRNRAEASGRPPPGGAGWSERVRPEEPPSEPETDEDGLTPEEAARRDEVERRQRAEDAARHRRETEANMRDDFERRRRESEAERAAEERAQDEAEAERQRRDAYFEGIQSTILGQPDHAQYPALLAELDRLQADGDTEGLRELWQAVRGDRQAQLDRQAERGDVYARQGQGLGALETGFTRTRDGARVILVAGMSAASGGVAGGTLGLGEAAVAAGIGLGGLGGVDGLQAGQKIVDNEVHWDQEAAERGAARGVRAGLGALVNGVPANGSILVATGKIGFTAVSDASQGYADEYQETGDREAAAARAGRTFGTSLANAAIGEAFSEAERLNAQRGDAAAMENPEWGDFIRNRTEEAKVRINAGKDAASIAGNTASGMIAEGKTLPQAVQDAVASEVGGKFGGKVAGSATSIHGGGGTPTDGDAAAGRGADVAARLQRERMTGTGASEGLGRTASEAMSGTGGAAASGLTQDGPDLRTTARPDDGGGEGPARPVGGETESRPAGDGVEAPPRSVPDEASARPPAEDSARQGTSGSEPEDGAPSDAEGSARSDSEAARQRVIDRLQRERMGQSEPPPITPEYERELARRESGETAAPDDSTMRPGTREDYRHVRQGAGDTQGYTQAAQRYAQMISDKYGVQIIARPTGHDAPRLIEGGEAGPKSEAAKTKTGNPLDVDLGLDPRNVGLSSLFRPELPPQGTRSDADYARLRERYEQRLTEWNGRESTVLADDRVAIDGQRVVDAETGEPFAGDMDVFDIRGAHGETLPEAVVERVMAELRREPEFSQVMHGEHRGWDYSGADNAAVGDDLQTDYQRYRNIDGAIRERHRNAEGLVIFAPQSGMGRPTPGEAFYAGPGVDGGEASGEADNE